MGIVWDVAERPGSEHGTLVVVVVVGGSMVPGMPEEMEPVAVLVLVLVLVFIARPCQRRIDGSRGVRRSGGRGDRCHGRNAEATAVAGAAAGDGHAGRRQQANRGPPDATGVEERLPGH